MHRHYSYYWRRCRECGRPAVDASEYCNECEPDVDDDEDREPDAPPPDGLERLYEPDAVPEAFPCTCTPRFASSASLEPPEPRLDRLCPQHGDGGPDPDRAYEERRDQLMEDHLHGHRDNNED